MGIALRAWAVLTAALFAAVAPDAPLADAAMRGDVEQVRSLLRSGAEVNAAQGDGMTALHWAAELDHAPMAEMLIAAGARLEALTRLGGYTPLHLAAEAGSAEVTRKLLGAGANVHAASTTGVTALHLAARTGSVETITALVERGADVNAREGAWEQTPLMFAASRGRVDAIETLLAARADASLTSKVQSFAELSRQERTTAAIRDSVLAIFRSQSPDPVTWRPDPRQVQAALRTAREREVLPSEPILHINWDSAQMAGRVPASGDVAGFQGGLTALLHAVREGHRDAAFALLDAGADIDQQSAGDRSTPLVSAMLNGHFDLGLELLARGADPNIANYPSGVTPLYAVINTQWASKSRYPQQQAYQQQRATYLETMEALLKAGADANVRLTLDYWYLAYNFVGVGINWWGATPFFRAAHAQDIAAMKLLVQHGADPNIPLKAPAGNRHVGGEIPIPEEDKSGLPPVPIGGPGKYPIHAAAGNSDEGHGRANNAHRHVRDGWLPAVRYLVEELGADVTLRDDLGYTTIHGAANRGWDDLILYLIEKGADPFAVGRAGLTTVDVANGPADGLSPLPKTMALLEGLGVKNNHLCAFCKEPGLVRPPVPF
jgi:ankyrin repeat protein